MSFSKSHSKSSLTKYKTSSYYDINMWGDAEGISNQAERGGAKQYTRVGNSFTNTVDSYTFAYLSYIYLYY